MSLDELSRVERLRLMRFVCSFAWADLEIHPQERQFVALMLRRLELPPEEQDQVRRWLDTPPSPDSVDPTQIPATHRRLFVEWIDALVRADERVSAEELEQLSVFAELLT